MTGRWSCSRLDQESWAVAPAGPTATGDISVRRKLLLSVGLTEGRLEFTLLRD